MHKIMALFKITAKRTGTCGKVYFEKVMMLEVALQGKASSTDSIKKIKEALSSHYISEIEHLDSITYLEYEKLIKFEEKNK